MFSNVEFTISVTPRTDSLFFTAHYIASTRDRLLWFALKTIGKLNIIEEFFIRAISTFRISPYPEKFIGMNLLVARAIIPRVCGTNGLKLITVGWTAKENNSSPVSSSKNSNSQLRFRLPLLLDFTGSLKSWRFRDFYVKGTTSMPISWTINIFGQ